MAGTRSVGIANSAEPIAWFPSQNPEIADQVCFCTTEPSGDAAQTDIFDF
jgi:hypothetical protein